MCQKYTADELNTMNHDTKNEVIYQMQERLDKLEHDYENLIEQIRLANQERFGRHTEKLDDLVVQLSFFNEAEFCYNENAKEPTMEETVDDALRKPRRPKKKGQREEDLKDFPQEIIPHDVSEKQLISTFGEGNYKSMPDEICWQLRFEPGRWIAEKHVIKVYVGTDGLHQDEFLRGDHPRTLFRGSIATPSLEAAIINAKYVNSNPLDRLSRDFKANGLNLSKQTMSNWTVWSAERYFQVVYDLMKSTQLKAHVNQCDETVLEYKTICIDYSSPNIAKNFHVGHLRTTIIGNSLYKIFDKLGYKVVRINHLGDWGTQFGKLIVAYKKWSSKEIIEKRGIDELLDIYVKFNSESEKSPELVDEARMWFVKMEQGDQEALEIWEWFKEISMVEFERIYEMIGISFDTYLGESYYRSMVPALAQQLKEKKLLTESQGANVIDLSEYDMPPCMITKKDGGSIYHSRDICALLYRKEHYDFDKCLYVTGMEQNLHFKQVFKAIEEKNPKLIEKEMVAKKIGIGAVIFNDLFNQRIKNVDFSWDDVLSFEGSTGLYVQYTYARAKSILRKSNVEIENQSICYASLTDDITFELIKTLSGYEEAIKSAACRYEPSIVARYIISVASSFNTP